MSNENKSIQHKMTELSELIEWFNGDEFSLENAVEMFKKAEQLAETIETDLNALKNDIQVVKQKFDQEN